MPRLHLRDARIIRWLLVLAAALLAGCSSVRLLYGTAPQLSWWWLDGYADFRGEHANAARAAVDRFWDWHRRTQLPEYAVWLAGVAPRLADDMTPAQVCQIQQQVRSGLEPGLQQALTLAADLVPALGEPQFKAIEARYAKNNAKMRDDFLQPDRTERAHAAFDRTVERAERLYGTLGAAQKSVLREGLATSPFDPEAWLADRQRAQRDTIATLRKLVADRAGPGERLAALRALAQRTERSTDPAYRAYQQRLADYNCAFAARLHNATTAAQRQTAREHAQGWEADLRALTNGY